ncbi:MAG: hypothetical protein WBD16_04670 [Pyrinomonadaceae bacterium]
MQTFNMSFKKRFMIITVAVLVYSGCGDSIIKSDKPSATSMRVTPAVRLNFRYEADVPAPAADPSKTLTEERSAAVQTDFDANRAQDEILDRTISSPDKKSVVAVYHRSGDTLDEFRLDMYSPDGKLLRKLTADTMAAHFPETIRWSPDSTTLAFVAILRVFQTPATAPATTPENATQPVTDVNANTAEPANTETQQTVAPSPATAPTPAAPTGILAFRTEQIYICNADGGGVKPLTQDDGLKYFYYAWSPDSTMLVALAATAIEWRAFVSIADVKGEQMIPWGRSRIIEKNGRARRLDDTPTEVFPAWSPDSSKVAIAYGRQVSAFGQRAVVNNQIRIYDALGTNPTQAAIPLRNQLLISSQNYQQQPSAESNTNVDASIQTPPSTPAANVPLSSLPKEEELVSYNPIVNVAWTADDLIYFETAYVKRMKNEAENAHSFARWHRIVLSTQPTAAVK